MSTKKKPVKPHCPVRGCHATQPHTDDPLIKALVLRYTGPDKLLGWVQASLDQIHDSIVDDYNRNRHFGWITRLRQIEELYFRTLYITFLTPDDQIPHWLSGEPPNSFTRIYKEVNEQILKGRGRLTDVQTDPGLYLFTPMNWLHSGGHANYTAMKHVAAYELAKVVPDIEPYLKHVETYIDRIDYMRKLFKAGRNKETVQEAVINLHRPLEHWQQKAKEGQDSISWKHCFAPDSEPKLSIANLCAEYEVKCVARGGHEVCPGHRVYDPVTMTGGTPGSTIWCTCACHQMLTRPAHSYRP